jgi:hypothetical protein
MQGIFDRQFDRAESFPLWFAVIAIASMSGSLLNSRIVMTLGMRRVVTSPMPGIRGPDARRCWPHWAPDPARCLASQCK